MLYVPGKLLFIHIPRTGGNAITRCLVERIAWTHDFQAWTSGSLRHMRMVDARRWVPDFDDITRVAIDRPLLEIVKSDYRLHQRAEGSGDCEWSDSVRTAKNESLSQFKRRRWDHWLGGVTPWQYWCHNSRGRDLSTHYYQFKDILAAWWMMLDALELEPFSLSHVDWQRDHG